MIINPQIFRNYDIRGIVDDDLDAIKFNALGKAYGTFLHRRNLLKIVCGGDCRLSSEEYKKSFIDGVLSTGIDVIDIGMVMTQMVYFAQYHYETEGGAMITASHNPWNYNGLKLAIGYSQTTGPEDLQEIKMIVDQDKYYVSDKPGVLSMASVKDEYRTDVLKKVSIKRSFKVVIDSHHGTTGLYNPEIFRLAGCKVVEVNSKVDGRFPAGTPDPTDFNLMKKLSEEVLKNSADLGFAFDGDGDRVGVVDEKGQIIWNDIVLAIFSLEILERTPGSKIIYNTLCSQVVPKVIRQHGGIPIMWKTGHTFIKAKIAQEKAAFGGELSGHFFFADNSFGHDDGTYAALRLLEYISNKKELLSKIYESFPKYISSPEIKIGCPDDRKSAVINDLKIKFKLDFPEAIITDDSTIPGDDGVRADFNDGMIIFRYSQNGPYITIKFEAKDDDTFEIRRNYVRVMLKKYPEMIWDDELCINLSFIA